MTPSFTNRSRGFTLMEIVITMGIIAITIPAILGILHLISGQSEGVIDRREVSGVQRFLELYLDGELKDTQSASVVSFDTAYAWLAASESNPTNPSVVYAYRTSEAQESYAVSSIAPAGLLAGKVFAAELLPPAEEILPAADLTSATAPATRSVLPMTISIHALSLPTQARTMSNRIDSYPLVITR